MTEWTRSPRQRLCGSCGSHIREGAPMLVLSRDGQPWRLYRCEGCAGAAPPELPAYVQRSQMTSKMVKLSRVELPFDWKQKAAGQ